MTKNVTKNQQPSLKRWQSENQDKTLMAMRSVNNFVQFDPILVFSTVFSTKLNCNMLFCQFLPVSFIIVSRGQHLVNQQKNQRKFSQAKVPIQSLKRIPLLKALCENSHHFIMDARLRRRGFRTPKWGLSLKHEKHFCKPIKRLPPSLSLILPLPPPISF